MRVAGVVMLKIALPIFVSLFAFVINVMSYSKCLANDVVGAARKLSEHIFDIVFFYPRR